MSDRPHQAATAESEAERVRHISAVRYWVVFGALAAFTALTYVLARMDLGSLNLPLALLIAATKASLVVLFFMHLWDHGGASRLVFVVALFVVLLVVGILGDVRTRFPLALPKGERIGEQARRGRSAH